MNRYIYYIVASLLLLVGCNKESQSESPEEPNVGFGRLALTSSVVDGVTSRTTTSDDKYYIDSELIPTSAELSLTIEGSYIDSDDGKEYNLSLSYDSLDDYNTDEESDGELCPPTLPAGTYTFTLSNGGDITIESATNACFEGSEEITIYAKKFDAENSIDVTLQNSIIRISTTELFEEYFAGGATLTLSTENGTTIEYDTQNKSEEVLFVVPSTTLYLEGEGVTQDTTESPDSGSTYTFSKSEIGETTKATMTSVVVDATEVSNSTLSIILDNTVTYLPFDSIELNP